VEPNEAADLSADRALLILSEPLQLIEDIDGKADVRVNVPADRFSCALGVRHVFASAYTLSQTNTMDATMNDVKGTPTFPLFPANLTAGWLMKEAERRKMGERIRELRERSPYKQRDMARKLRISTRMYQKNEERGTSDWGRVQKIARIHKVDPLWIWTGEDQPTPTNLDRRLSQMEKKIDRVLNALDSDAAIPAASKNPTRSR
jgi:transcriptional regulator with XRE-family HTH domain